MHQGCNIRFGLENVKGMHSCVGIRARLQARARKRSENRLQCSAVYLSLSNIVKPSPELCHIAYLIK
jgi:hypothetical protein